MKIHLSNGSLLLSQIQKDTKFHLKEYEKKALKFCMEWMQGKDSFLLHTSGSTGAPKPIELTRKQMQASARMTQTALGLRSNDKALVCLNIEYIAGMMMLVRCMEVGMDMTIIEPSSNPFAELKQTSFDFTALVPLQLHALLHDSHSISLANQMKAILVGGAAINQEVLQNISLLHAPVYSTYGMTETVSHIALRRLNGEMPSEFYTLLPGISAHVDQRGCLAIQSQELTDNTIIFTNDLVEMRTDREFKWIGRIDHVINTGGIKASAEQLEHAMAIIFERLRIERRFFICGMPDILLGEVVSLVIEGNALPTTIYNRLLEIFNIDLNKYHAPKNIFFLPKFIETDNGKIDRKKTKLLLL